MWSKLSIPNLHISYRLTAMVIKVIHSSLRYRGKVYKGDSEVMIYQEKPAVKETKLSKGGKTYKSL